MSDELKLKPCPFCGGEASFKDRVTGGEAGSFDVQCGTLGCYLQWGADWCYKKPIAAALWNKRPEEMGKVVSMVEHYSSLYVATEKRVYQKINGEFRPLKWAKS